MVTRIAGILFGFGILLTVNSRVAANPTVTDSAEHRSILLIAGEASHGWNEHEYPASGEVLVDCINQSGLAVDATLSVGWPDPALLEQMWDCVVIYSDGVERHVAADHVDALNRMLETVTGFAVLHFALEPPSPTHELAGFLESSVGGFFKIGHSVNPVWTLDPSLLGQHSITSGVEPFAIKDEWYYHLFFPNPGRITPVLSALPPIETLGSDGPRSGNRSVREALKLGEKQVLSWVFENEWGGRGFGFTGGHFHHNWNQEDFRKLVLNGILWTAKIEIPENGVYSDIPPILKYRSVEEAIARGDFQDLQRHIERQPSIVNQPGRGQYTPLHVAILRQHRVAVDLLLENGADPNLLTSADENALHLAVKRGTSEMVEALMNAGAKASQRDRVGWTPLHHAAAKSKIDIAKALIRMGADVNFRSAAGGTALHEAAASGSGEMIELLLKAGVDAGLKSENGKTALDVALEFENQAAISILQNT